MKKTFLILLSIFSLWSINAQNYGNGNGSIISEDTIHDDWQIIRKKHIQTVKMAEDCDVPNDYKSLWKDFSLLYESDYTLIQEWGELPLISDCSGKIINIKEIINISRNHYYNPDLFLFYVEVDGQTGYMRAFQTEWELYEDGRWSIVGQIESSGQKWNVRKVRENTMFDVRERLYVRDKPGTNGTKKIYLFYKDEELPEEYNSGKLITVTKVTDEKEIIDGREGRWLYIEYENIEGWVFEGYVFKDFFWGYFEPEDIINLFFTDGQP